MQMGFFQATMAQTETNRQRRRELTRFQSSINPFGFVKDTIALETIDTADKLNQEKNVSPAHAGLFDSEGNRRPKSRPKVST
jgi:hypothetical protein